MKIRWKLLILLLGTALVPLVVSSLVHRAWAKKLSGRLASRTRTILAEDARRHLQTLVDDYGKILKRSKTGLELALKIQAQAVERRLGEEPDFSRRVYSSRDYDQTGYVPKGMVASDRHYRPDADGGLQPIDVTYEEQVYFVVRGVERDAVADDMARLSTMPEVYRVVYDSNPDLMYWQYTSLESGFHTCYPGHGGYPDDYDPRVRRWYVQAKAADRLVEFPPMVEVSTRTITLAMSMPVHRPDGSFAGVTAIDIPLKGIFKPFNLPPEWSAGARSMIVGLARTGEAAGKKLAIAAEQAYEGRMENWREVVELRYLESPDEEELEELKKEALAGKSGVRRMGYRRPLAGQEEGYEEIDALWAYGAGSVEEMFPVVIVPYEQIVAEAEEVEQHILDRTSEGLITTGIILAVVIVGVVVLAFVNSQRVSKPIRQITEAGRKLAGGDYAVKVDIRTGDELQELGEVFNSTGPKLEERERMKQSLALAMEIQQHLLPQEAPELEGFDIVGKSIYCDETGGDYYDFIELRDLGPKKLGIAIGDVTGHGIGAALLMASARGVLRSYAGRHGGDLSGLFGALNTHLFRDTGDERFMTLFYGVVDAQSRSLRWTSGGHDPAMWLRRGTGEVEELANTGIPLGIMERFEFDSGGPVILERGDVVLIGTDGIWEARNSGAEMFGKGRLREILKSSADKSAEEIYDAVVEAVKAHITGMPQADDITLVVIKAV